jgi:hypothetical protein
MEKMHLIKNVFLNYQCWFHPSVIAGSWTVIPSNASFFPTHPPMIKLVSETVVLWQAGTRLIEGEPFLFLMTSGPTGVMGDSALVLRLTGTVQ